MPLGVGGPHHEQELVLLPHPPGRDRLKNRGRVMRLVDEEHEVPEHVGAGELAVYFLGEFHVHEPDALAGRGPGDHAPVADGEA